MAGAGRPPLSAGRQPELSWLQPVPYALLDPAAVVEAREATRLALVAAMQYLSPRQRAVLILRDVLGWRAAEVASLLDTSTAAVNSALQRARTQLTSIDKLAEPAEPRRRELLDRYAAAFEKSDIVALTRLLTEDATWEMLPMVTWFTGRDPIVRFLATRFPEPGGHRALATAANGQPAFALYLRDGDRHLPHALHRTDPHRHRRRGRRRVPRSRGVPHVRPAARAGRLTCIRYPGTGLPWTHGPLDTAVVHPAHRGAAAAERRVRRAVPHRGPRRGA